MTEETQHTESGNSPPAANRGHRRYEPVICVRCQEPRWPYGGARPADYLCQRCSDTLAGAPNVVDPCPERSPAQKAADVVRAAHLKAHRDVRKPRPAHREVFLTPAAVSAPIADPEPFLPVDLPRCRCRRAACSLGCNEMKPEADSGLPPQEWRSLRAQVIKRDGRRCKHCGTRERLTVHHITPRPLGTNDPRNLVTLCSSCHDAVEQPSEVTA